jgi:hypothetical protein
LSSIIFALHVWRARSRAFERLELFRDRLWDDLERLWDDLERL